MVTRRDAIKNLALLVAGGLFLENCGIKPKQYNNLEQQKFSPPKYYDYPDDLIRLREKYRIREQEEDNIKEQSPDNIKKQIPDKEYFYC